MNDVQIRCFLESAKFNSFSKAANILFLSQPTVSRNIGDLEREWNVLLFDRNGGNVSLTEAGKRMAEFWTEEQEKFHEVLDDVRKETGEGEVRIAILNGQMINSVIRDAVRKMKEQYPEIRTEFERYDYDEILDLMVRRKVDIAELPKDSIRFKGKKSAVHCQYQTYLVIPDSLAQEDAAEPDIRSYLKETLIMVDKKSRDPDGYVKMWTEKCEQYHVQPSIRWAADIKQQEMLVELGEGVAICNINHMMTNSPHTRFVLLKELKPLPFELIVNDQNRNPAVEKFLSCVDFRPNEII